MKPEKNRSPKMSVKKTATPAPAAGPEMAAAAAKTPRTRHGSPAKPTTAARKTSLQVPAILLEGDTPSAPTPAGPGKRYELGPTPPGPHAAKLEEPRELPEAYGTKTLLLTARDPHWLYAHWDLTREQLKEYNALSADRHLVLRVYIVAIAGQPLTEIHVHPESRNWFVHVGRGGAKYLAELGYYQPDRNWITISSSKATLTPPDSLSADTSAQFTTIPSDVSFQQLLAVVKEAVTESVPLTEAIQQLRATTHEEFPVAEKAAAARITATQWTTAQEQAFARLVSMDEVRRVWVGSLEITELVRRHLLQDVSSAGVAQFGQPGAGARAVSPIPGISSLGSLASPFGAGEERKKGFWFNVNAELIIYGATEADATVTIGGRTIKLRSDGTFSYRFALPDGTFQLPAVATAADGTDSRSAALEFSRRTDYRGEVGTHPQEAQLKAPLAANVA